MKFFILTDLEGVAGTDSFTQTRTSDESDNGKGPSMRQLAREVNACVRGIREVYPDAEVDVLDGHGTLGIFPQDLEGCNYLNLKEGKQHHHQLEGYAALLFVGQHAMAGTVDAPLCHTFSSRDIMYYRLNGIFVGEFGLHALQAGVQGVPTIFLSGDDKAALEARMFIPNIETVAVKQGKGLESAVHMESQEACEQIQQGTARAVKRMHEISPYTGIQSPYCFEARYYEPLGDGWREKPHVKLVDDRTYRLETEDLFALPF